MPKQWAKIGRDVKDSDRLTALLGKNPLAEALYWRIKAMADDFGRYLGDPAEVGAGVCPRNLIGGTLKLKKLEQALDDMEACNVIHRYAGPDGKAYIEITDYLNHAHDQWANVGKPEYPAPPGWTPPESLVQFLCQHAKARNVTAERFGVSIECWPQGTEYPFNTHSIPTERVLNTPPIDLDSDSDRDSDVEGDSDAPAGAPEPILPVDTHLLTCNDSFTAEVKRYFCSSNPSVLSVTDAQAYAVKCKQLCGVGNADFTESDLLDAITNGANGPTPGGECDVKFGPQKWVDRLRREKQATARASPPPGAPLPHGQHGSGVLTL